MAYYRDRAIYRDNYRARTYGQEVMGTFNEALNQLGQTIRLNILDRNRTIIKRFNFPNTPQGESQLRDKLNDVIRQYESKGYTVVRNHTYGSMETNVFDRFVYAYIYSKNGGLAGMIVTV